MKPCLPAFVTVLAGALLVLFLGTRLGLSIRATGDNIDMVRASSINPTFTITVGLCISNALTALSGAMVGQYQNTADINGGTGIVVIGLACLIIGETVLGRRSSAERSHRRRHRFHHLPLSSTRSCFTPKSCRYRGCVWPPPSSSPWPSRFRLSRAGPHFRNGKWQPARKEADNRCWISVPSPKPLTQEPSMPKKLFPASPFIWTRAIS